MQKTTKIRFPSEGLLISAQYKINTFQRSQQAFEPIARGFWHPLKLVVNLKFDRALHSFVYQNGVDQNLCLARKINVF